MVEIIIKIASEYKELNLLKKLSTITVILLVCIIMAIDNKLWIFLKLWFSTSLMLVIHLEWRKRERELNNSLRMKLLCYSENL